MKKYKLLLRTLGLLITVSTLQGQSSLNLVAGWHSANSHSTLSTDFIKLESIERLTFGVIYDQKLDNLLSLRTGGIYKQNGFQIKESTQVNMLGTEIPIGVKAVAELNTIEVPLMLQYNVSGIKGIKPYLSMGPSFSYATSGQIRTKATAFLDWTLTSTPLNLESDDYNRLGINGNVAVGTKIEYNKGHFITEINYASAFTSLTNESFIVDTGLRPKGWTINIGYGLSF